MAINEANGLNRIPANLVTEKEEFVYRSYLALGQYHIILSEIKENSTTPVCKGIIMIIIIFFPGSITLFRTDLSSTSCYKAFGNGSARSFGEGNSQSATRGVVI